AGVRPHQKLEDQPPTLSRGARSGERGHRRRRAPRSPAGVTRLELVYGVFAAGANVLGALAVTARVAWSVRVFDALLSLAAGFLISVSLVDLFPDGLARGGATAGFVVLGAYVLVHLTQHTIGRHFHFGEETHAVSTTVSMSALIGLLMHTFVDGVAVA